MLMYTLTSTYEYTSFLQLQAFLSTRKSQIIPIFAANNVNY